jgi:hypothetical protein
MKLYMFRTVPLSIIRSSFTVHSAMVYVIKVSRHLSSMTRMFHPGPADDGQRNCPKHIEFHDKINL